MSYLSVPKAKLRVNHRINFIILSKYMSMNIYLKPLTFFWLMKSMFRFLSNTLCKS